MLTFIPKYSAFLKRILKYVVSFLALGYISYRIATTPFHIQNLTAFFTFKVVASALFLASLNWFFEILKWKVAIATFTTIGFLKASYETLVAYTYGWITPFNSGNYLKKMFFYNKEHRKKIVFLNLCKGLYQMLFTFVFGCWGVSYLIEQLNFAILNQQQFLITMLFIGCTMAAVFPKKILRYVKSIPVKTHGLLVVLSLLKFLCFSLLIFILLYQPNLPKLDLYAGICVVYLFSSLLPILNILDFAFKGSVALWVLVSLGYLEANILIAYFILWISNHALPAILGCVLQFYLHQKKEL